MNNNNFAIMVITQFARNNFEDNDSDSDIEVAEKIDNFVEGTIPNFSDYQFQLHFRMNSTTFENVVQKIGLYANIPGVGYPRISLEKELLVTVWYLGNMESFRSVADRFGISKSTCWEVLYRTCNLLLVTNKRQRIIHWPSQQRQAKISDAFRVSSGFGGIIGCIDGTHIPIIVPKENRNSYINRKGFYSVLLQAVCDHERLFTDVYAGEAGSVHDSTVYRRSELYQQIQNHNIIFYNDSYLIGDLAYPLNLHMIVGFKNNGHLTPRQKNFNIHLNKSRVKIEMAFALLKGRFRRLKSIETIRLDLIVLLIVTGCILHNICITNADFIEGLVDLEQERQQEILNNPRNFLDLDQEQDRHEALQKRLDIVNSLPLRLVE